MQRMANLHLYALDQHGRREQLVGTFVWPSFGIRSIVQLFSRVKTELSVCWCCSCLLQLHRKLARLSHNHMGIAVLSARNPLRSGANLLQLLLAA